MTPRHLLFAALLLAASPLAAQEKRALTPADFDQWRTVRGSALSDDGRWAAFTLVPQVGDGEVVVRATDGGAEHRHTRGYVGRPQTRPGATGPEAGFQVSPARFSDDARFVVFTVEPSRAEVERARREKKKAEDQPKASLGIMALPAGTVTLIPRVKQFDLPQENGRWLAYLLEKDTASAAAPKPDSAAAQQAPAAAATPGGTARPVSADTSAKRDGKKKETGSTLVLRDLSSGAEVWIDDVTAFRFDRGGRWLGYTVAGKDDARDGVYVRSLQGGATHALATGKGSYRSLAFDRAGMQAAFVSDRDEAGRDRPRHSLYHASLRGGRPQARAVVASERLGEGRVVAERGTIRFTDDGGVLVFGVAAAPLDSIPADSLSERAVFDLWHWKDPQLQTQQRVQAGRPGSAPLAVYHVDGGRWTVLGSDSTPTVRLSEDGRTALVFDPSRYAVSSMWGEGGDDLYVVDTRTGTRRRVAERVPHGGQLSPGGRFVAWFGADRRWHAYDVAAGRAADLTGALGVRFDRETWDLPGDPESWGHAGWTEGDRSLLVYDRYDVWELDPAGRRSARAVTDSVGRRGRMVFRWVDLDSDEESIDPSEPLLFRVTDDETRATGFWRDRLGAAGAPARLVMEDRQLGTPQKAEDAEVYLVTREDVDEAPDLYAAGASFTDLRRLSDANPQQGRYRWTSVEMVRWRSADGVELKGLLYRPEDFDPSRQYPMVVYFYEQLSENLHDYVAPAGRNVINPTVYASNGYLVFMPDIHYVEGYPGESALKSIVPGVQALVARGFVDPQAVGIQGQSWGGYQAAYIITRTNLFRAAMAGAPVANMTSAYGGIRYGSGLARLFQYEAGQSRIGGSLWETPGRYLENSPLFAADRVQTPLLIMHNDADGAVPWTQGIEMFLALRRLGKETYLINYNGDEHNPTKRANQLDISIRMMQFFDHHLRGRPAPEWMARGVPFLRKNRDQVLPVAAAAEPGPPAQNAEPGVPPAPPTQPAPTQP